MKYFLIEITETEEKFEKGVYEYNTLEDAEAVFHQKMGSAMKAKVYKSELLMVINDAGGVYPDLNKKWNRQQPEPEE